MVRGPSRISKQSQPPPPGFYDQFTTPHSFGVTDSARTRGARLGLLRIGQRGGVKTVSIFLKENKLTFVGGCEWESVWSTEERLVSFI